MSPVSGPRTAARSGLGSHLDNVPEHQKHTRKTSAWRRTFRRMRSTKPCAGQASIRMVQPQEAKDGDNGGEKGSPCAAVGKKKSRNQQGAILAAQSSDNPRTCSRTRSSLTRRGLKRNLRKPLTPGAGTPSNGTVGMLMIQCDGSGSYGQVQKFQSRSRQTKSISGPSKNVVEDIGTVEARKL